MTWKKCLIKQGTGRLKGLRKKIVYRNLITRQKEAVRDKANEGMPAIGDGRQNLVISGQPE
jgi:hypothetical protein